MEVRRIIIDILPNGYSLKYDGMSQKGGFMYFNLLNLLRGLCCHIGFEIKKILDVSKLQDIIDTCVRWKDNKDCVNEIERLSHEVATEDQRRRSIAARLVIERRKRITLRRMFIEAANEFKDYPDKRVVDGFMNVVRRTRSPRPITLRSLGFDEDDPAEIEEEEE